MAVPKTSLPQHIERIRFGNSLKYAAKNSVLDHISNDIVSTLRLVKRVDGISSVKIDEPKTAKWILNGWPSISGGIIYEQM